MIYALIFAFLGYFSYSPVSVKEIQVVTITHKDFKGDMDQINGISRALSEVKQDKDTPLFIKVTPKTNEDYVEAFQESKENKTYVVITSNHYGIEALKNLRSSGQKFIGVLTSHQYIDAMDQLVDGDIVDILALPKHAVNEEIQKKFERSRTKLVKTNGVSQNLLPAVCDDAYKTHQEEITEAHNPSSKYLLVVLGGDTQNSDGKTWKYFTAEEAKKLAASIAKLAREKDLKVLVTNGPRTGKFNHETGEPSGAHKNDITDTVTLAFKEALEAKGIHLSKKQLFDFQEGKPSMFTALIGALRTHPGSIALIEGGSTSMISQAIENLKYMATIASYEHGAMNDVHIKHIQQEFEAGRIKILDKDGNLQKNDQAEQAEKNLLPTEEVVAAEIIKLLR